MKQGYITLEKKQKKFFVISPGCVVLVHDVVGSQKCLVRVLNNKMYQKSGNFEISVSGHFLRSQIRKLSVPSEILYNVNTPCCKLKETNKIKET